MQFKEGGSESTKNFLILKSGESVSGVFRGEPYTFRSHWDANRSSLCLGEDCPLCKSGNKAKFRFRLNIIVKEGGVYVSKVFEQGWTVYEALKAIHEGGYDLEHHVMKITRNGDGLETTYSILPAPNGILNEEAEAKVALVPLQVLFHELDQKESELRHIDQKGDFREEDIPF